jgi:hypothetical protein
MRYAFEDADAAERRETQYFEMFCNRGIYHQGWTAVTRHSTPWVLGPLPPFADDTWELYDTSTDWSQAHDLAAEMPERLEELKALFLEEARKYNVLPLDDRRVERFDSNIAGRPTLVRGNSQLLFGGMARLTENATINVKNKSHSVTAEVTVPDEGAEGVIVSQGGAYAGWSLYLKEGRPTYCYNLFGLERFHIRGDVPVPAGTHQVRMEFGYDGGGLGRGGTVSLFVDGATCGEGRGAAPRPGAVPRRRSRPARARLARLSNDLGPRRPERLPQLVGVRSRRVLEAAGREGDDDQRPRQPPRHARRIRGRRGVRDLGRQGAADRGGVGARRPRRARGRGVRLG